MGWARPAIGALLAAGLALHPGCSSDHEGLKKKPPGTGGTGGGLPDGSDEDVAIPDTGPDVPIEPEGTPRLTLFHAVVDSPKIAFCFSKVTDGVPGPAIGDPLPAGGLDFARPLVVDSLSGLDWKTDDIQTTIVAGDFALLSGKSCAEAIELAASLVPVNEAATDAAAADADDAEAAPPPPPDPPAVRAAELPVLPAPTLGKGYSYLLAATGCIGGPAFTDPDEIFLCGTNYTPDSPTVAPIVVKMSRIVQPGNVGIQVLNTSLGSDPIDLQSQAPPTQSLPGLDLVYGVPGGAISPTTPNLAYSATMFGSPLTQAKIQVTPYGSGAVSFETTWADALGVGGADLLEDGKSYVIVLSGPRSTLVGGKWWNGPALGVLPSDPQ
jgi:hypothetical protein